MLHVLAHNKCDLSDRRMCGVATNSGGLTYRGLSQGDCMLHMLVDIICDHSMRAC